MSPPARSTRKGRLRKQSEEAVSTNSTLHDESSSSSPSLCKQSEDGMSINPIMNGESTSNSRPENETPECNLSEPQQGNEALIGAENNTLPCNKSSESEVLSCFVCKVDFNISTLKVERSVFSDMTKMMEWGMRWHCKKCLNGGISKYCEFENLQKVVKSQLHELTQVFDKKLEVFQSQFMSKLNGNSQTSDTTTESGLSRNLQPMKHTIVVKSDDSDDLKFSDETWSTVVKKSITPTLKHIPVSKTTITKDGKGILFFPSDESRDQAASSLKDKCSIESQDKETKMMYPKLKISGIPQDVFGEEEKNNTEKGYS